MQVLGIDIGGSGIKGAPVDTETGMLLAERHRIATPRPVTPTAVAKTVAKVARHFDWDGPVGCGFPAVITRGIVRTASNIDASWIGTDARSLLADATACNVAVLNDADAAGLAELTFGAIQDHHGLAVLITIGTGLGSVLFKNGILLPNTEFGHLRMNGMIAEQYASDAARKREALSWKKWAKRFDEYLNYLEFLLRPELFVIGGGASKKSEKFFKYLTVQAEVVPAQLLNEAGIVGGALAYRYEHA